MVKANVGKWHLTVSVKVKSDCGKLVGVQIDTRLNFNEHLDCLLKKASRKVNVLARVTPYMNVNRRHLLMNPFFMSKFS